MLASSCLWARYRASVFPTVTALILIAAVIAWAAVHSLLASFMAKNRAERALGASATRAYRLGYNLFAFITFLPILALVRLLPDRTIYTIQPPWLFVTLAGQAISAVCALMALLQTDPLHFIGLRQLTQLGSEPILVATGLYRHVRHPLYLFGLVFIWLTPLMTENVLIVFIALTVYIFVGAALEERRLLSQFGAAYAEYRRTTPMIIPGLRFHARAGSTPKGRPDA